MNEKPATEDRVDEPATDSTLRGRTLVTADGVTLGDVEAETETHLRVRTGQTDLPGGLLWIPKSMVDTAERDTVTLSRLRSELHDAVLAMPPGQQREFGSLGLNLRVGRVRGLGHSSR